MGHRCSFRSRSKTVKRYVALAALMGALSTPAAAQQMMAPAAAQMMLTPDTYRAMAMISDSFELEAARLAQQRSASAAVRNYANMMIRDHSMKPQALMGGVQMAALGGMAPALDSRHAAMLNQLGAASGPAVRSPLRPNDGHVASGSARLAWQLCPSRHRPGAANLQLLQGFERAGSGPP